ncbi:MAG: TldD/PmbA family protein [Nitrospirota bacterium]|nr:TldD/PmbA family protein [Nitrospirota bacterium]
MSPDPGFAEDILGRALKKGADQAEVFYKSYKNITVEIKDQTVESLSSSFSSGYCVRVIRNHCLGFSFSTELSESDQVIARAMDACRSVDEDLFHSLPSPSTPTAIDIFDNAIRDLKEDDAIRMAMQIERAAYDTDSRIKRVRKPSTSFTVAETIIANSLGVKAQYQSTSCSAQLTAVAESGNENQTGWDYMGSRFLEDISCEDVGRTAARSALRLLGSRKMQGRKTTVILDHAVANDFLGIFAASLSSDAVQKGKSLLAGRLNTLVISPKISIMDSGLVPGRLGSKPLDDEGVATQSKALIKEGVLLSYLFNTYTARKGNTVSTGNAMRGSHASLPSVGITNLYLEPASPADCVLAKDLFKTIDKGLYVVDAMGIHMVNPISGDFSIGVTGLWIEQGEVAFPVKEALISGNLLDFFRKVSAVGDDMKFYGSLGSPSLIIPDIDVSA